MREFFIAWLLLTGLFTVMFLAVYTVEGLKCEAQAQEMGVAYKWGYWTGCMVEVNGRFIPLKNYRMLE